MKIQILFLSALFTFILVNVDAQEASSSYMEISKKLGMYVFPNDNQDAATQETDEIACYKWAKSQSGIDPMNITVEAEQVETGPDGSAVRGAARGAAAGAAIGAIAGDAGKGAAIGAAAGGMGGVRGKRTGDAQQQQKNEQSAVQQEQAMKAEFNKAFSVCMEGKGYTIK